MLTRLRGSAVGNEVGRTAVTMRPLQHARELAELTGATVLLKGATQLVATPGRGTVEVAVPGSAWTAQAGSGDVLAGICGALLAAGLPAPQAAAVGASLQAMASSDRPVAPQEYRLSPVG